jgi:Vitamin K-dependent gamma-carboxylase
MSRIANQMATPRRLYTVIENFFLEPASPSPLGALRIGVAFVLLIQAFLLKGSILDFFAHDGMVQGELARFLSMSNAPRLSLLVPLFAKFGINETGCLYFVCGGYVVSLFLLLLGLETRLAAIASFLLHWTLMNTGYSTAYGVDAYAHFALFYLMLFPAGSAYSLDVTLGRTKNEASTMARLGLRVIQLHLCLSYLSSGIEKAMGPQWWNGELLWRALSLPEYQVFNMSWLAEWPVLSKIAGWMTLVVELGYSIFIWPTQTRVLWIIAVIGLHLGIAIFLGLGSFGYLMCVLTACVFGVSATPKPGSAMV